MVSRLLRLIFGEQIPRFKFRKPSGWSVEDADGGKLLVCLEPEENWTANMFFELRRDDAGRDLSEMIDDLAGGLQAAKSQFVLVDSGLRPLATGQQSGFVEYLHDEGRARLRDRQTLIPLAKPWVLFVLASTADVVRDKYQPIFEQVMESIVLR